jgi:hypothetical protein
MASPPYPRIQQDRSAVPVYVPPFVGRGSSASLRACARFNVDAKVTLVSRHLDGVLIGQYRLSQIASSKGCREAETTGKPALAKDLGLDPNPDALLFQAMDPKRIEIPPAPRTGNTKPSRRTISRPKRRTRLSKHVYKTASYKREIWSKVKCGWLRCTKRPVCESSSSEESLLFYSWFTRGNGDAIFVGPTIIDE